MRPPDRTEREARDVPEILHTSSTICWATVRLSRSPENWRESWCSCDTRRWAATYGAWATSRARLERLSPRERACVVLRYYEDRSVDETAKELGIAPGSVKRYVSDAMAKLREQLATEETTQQEGA